MINLFVFNRAIAVQIWASGAKSPGKISSKSITNALASNEEFSGLRGTRLGPWAGLEIWCLGRQASPFSKLGLGTHLYETEFGISSKTTSKKGASSGDNFLEFGGERVLQSVDQILYAVGA